MPHDAEVTGGRAARAIEDPVCVDTAASAEQVPAALTDFSEAQLDIRPALDRERYGVHEL